MHTCTHVRSRYWNYDKRTNDDDDDNTKTHHKLYHHYATYFCKRLVGIQVSVCPLFRVRLLGRSIGQLDGRLFILKLIIP